MTENQPLKIVFGVILIMYVLILVTWWYRFPISYKLTNGSYVDLVVDHDFSEQEREVVERAYHIRQTISNVLIWSSVLLSVTANVYQRTSLSRKKAFVRGIMYISGILAIVLILVNGIHFIPGPPIR